MKRRLCAVGLSVVLTCAAIAGEPPRTISKKAGPLPAPAATAVQTPSAAGRKQLEALLQAPAKLDFGDRKQVTVGEVLDRLHEQHHLSLRFDTPTLASLMVPVGPATGGSCPAVATSFRPISVISTTNSVPSQSQYYAPGSSYQVQISGESDPYGNSPRAFVQIAEGTPPAAAASLADLAVAAPALAPAAAAPATAPAAAPASPAPAAAPALAPVAAAPATAPAAAPTSPAPAVAPATPAPPAAARPSLANGGVPSPPPVSLPSNDLGLPPAAEGPNQVPNPPKSSSPATTPKAPADIQEILAQLLKIEIDVQNLDLTHVSIATVLRHALDAAPTAGIEDFAGMPILFTNAMLLDYLIEDHGLLITTRMKALTSKETRVYSVKDLHDLPPDQLAKTIRQSIRPWSWRLQINDLGDQLKGAPLPSEMLTSIIKTGVQLAGAEVGISVAPSSVEEVTSEAKKSSGADEVRQMEMLGSAIVNGLVTLAQATLSTLEMVHYAEPPTGTIQTLGNKLIITQSQTAHREIADLLRQLAEE